MAGQHRVGLQQHVERVGQGVDVDGSFDVGGQTDEVLRLGEHLLAARELADRRRRKHGPLRYSPGDQSRLLAFRYPIASGTAMTAAIPPTTAACPGPV